VPIAADRAEALGAACFNAPAKALFALKGVSAQFFNILSKRVAGCAVLHKQILHKAPRLPRANTGEALKRFGESLDRIHKV
jgi:hypothetical protein